MAYVVDRVVICDAFTEPDKHYQLLAGGKSKLVAGRIYSGITAANTGNSFQHTTLCC